MDGIKFTLNGSEVTYSGSAEDRLLDVLRNTYLCRSVKCGCGEGECGACAVLIDRGILMNSCCVSVGFVEGREVTTLEGFREREAERFAVLDRAFAEMSAVQCGFCTPGMLLAAEALLSAIPHPTEEQVRSEMSGNLCRCTGYNAIVKAVLKASEEMPPHRKTDEVRIVSKGSFTAGSLAEAIELRGKYGLTPYAGGTDLVPAAARAAEGGTPLKHSGYLFLHNVPELRRITDDGEYVRIGACVTFAEALNDPLVPQLMKEAAAGIGSPAVRNAGTFGGNAANGSDKADTIPAAFAMDAKLRIASPRGERITGIEEFHLGHKKTTLADDELIVEILLPKRSGGHYFRKVGGRAAVSISHATFAGVFEERGGVITNAAAAFGAVADIVLRFRSLESMIVGKTLDEARAVKEELIRAYSGRLVTVNGRVNAEYCHTVCLNLLRDFLTSFGV